MRGLLIRKPWIDLILSGRKTWEIRGSATRVRGPIALIESGSGTVVGVCELTDCVGPLTLEEFRRALRRHRATPGWFETKLPYRRTHAWVLTGARRLARPIPYRHPTGAVLWVRLAATVARKFGGG